MLSGDTSAQARGLKALELSNSSRYELLTAANDKLGGYRAFKELCWEFGVWGRRDKNVASQAICSKNINSKKLKVNDEIGLFIDRQIIGIKRRKDPTLKLPFLAFQFHYLTEAHSFDLYYKRLHELRLELAKNHLPYTMREIKEQANLFIEELRHSIITVLYI